MTPRIPRGWVVATERGDGLWMRLRNHIFPERWRPRELANASPLNRDYEYIRRTDPAAPADPNEPWVDAPEPSTPLPIDTLPTVQLTVNYATQTATAGGRFMGKDWAITASATSETSVRVGVHVSGCAVVDVTVHGCSRSWDEPQEVASALLWSVLRSVALQRGGQVIVPDAAASAPAPEPAPAEAPLVPGMMRLVTCKGTTYAKIAAIGFIVRNDEGGTNVFLDISPRESFADKRDVPEFLAAYTDARDHTIRHDERTREEVRRASEPEVQTILREDVEGAAERLAKLPTVKPDLAEWPGRPEVPPGEEERSVLILTPHGECIGRHVSGFWYVRVACDLGLRRISADDVLAWRVPRATVVNERVTGVTRG